MDNNIALDLVTGSANINHMRNTIKQVVSMVCGLVDPIVNQAMKYDLPHSGNYCWWSIRRELCGSIYVTCSYGASRLMEGNFDRVPAQYVEQIYDSLPTFVEMMVDAFPSLEEKFRPYLNASKKSL